METSNQMTCQKEWFEKTKQFEDWINGMKDSYKSDHLLVPMGDDFRFKYF